MIYFTSDLHLGHEAIIRLQNRPFKNVDEMNRILIENFNSVVHKNDTVYLIGDICFRIGLERANELIASLNGKKYLIKGNHDKNYDKRLFKDVREFMTISANGYPVVLMHYPMLSWPKSYRGSFMLHGHIHSDERYNLENRDAGINRYDVGIDANAFKPISILQIVDFFNSKK
jgi:calcineurin-like phosphoesterase family protein